MVNFSYKAEELPQKLRENYAKARTGHWIIQINLPQESKWYLAVEQGRVLFSGTEQLGRAAFLKTLQRYLVPLRGSRAQEVIETIQKSAPEQLQLGKILEKMENIGLLTREDALKAIQLQILLDFDNYLFDSSGTAEFISEPGLFCQTQIPGFKLDDLILRAQQRKIKWKALITEINSIKGRPILHHHVLEKANLNPHKKQQIQKLASSEKTMEAIALDLGKDPLEIAQLFAKLTKSGIISIKLPPELTTYQKPEIFIVDDSPVLLQQFQSLVTAWGYEVNSCMNALTAIDQMLKSKPAVIFLDINMPRLSGFDLIKQIRRQPELASIPLVLLTAENSISNQWRAKWANCEFLAKPTSPQQSKSFIQELKLLLQEMAPLSKE